MPKTETEEIIRMQAEQAVQLQKIILEAQEFVQFVESGRLEWLREKIFKPLQMEMLLMVKGLDFVPNSVAQVAHIKGQLEVMDRIESRILGPIENGRVARQRLEELQNSTPQEG